MKLRNIFLVLFTMISLGAYAQTYGVKAGWSQSWLRGDLYEDESFERRNGFFIGAYRQFSFNKDFALQTEFIYTTAGGTIKDDKTSEEINIHFSQFQLPILAKISFVPLHKFTFQGGINFSYKTTSEIQYPKVKLSEKAFKKLDFGLTAGGTYHFKGFSQKGFFIDISFHYNLLNILNTSSTEIQGYDLVKENKLRSAITQIGVGYKI